MKSNALPYFSVYEFNYFTISSSYFMNVKIHDVLLFYFQGSAGILNWIVAIGPDTLKSRFQTGNEQ